MCTPGTVSASLSDPSFPVCIPGYQGQVAPGRWWHFAPAGFALDALDLADMRGWFFDIDLVIIYIHSVNWILALLVLCFLAYFFLSWVLFVYLASDGWPLKMVQLRFLGDVVLCLMVLTARKFTCHLHMLTWIMSSPEGNWNCEVFFLLQLGRSYI